MALTVEAAHARAEAVYQPRANRLGLWIFFASETFLFAAVISARFVTSGTDKPDDLNQALALGLTVVLLVSSVSAYLAESSIAADDRRGFMAYTRVTFVLGLVFLGAVMFEWREALEHFPPETIYGSSFFALVGLHAFHVLTGVLALAVLLILGPRGHFGAQNSWPVEGVVKYWHFVDLMWVVIYPTLYLF
ncbi:MAG: cytochrome c oxidase subunit 3 [Acidimicrobiia bacterium]|nr:cytochrome c oxidase subunit 3 [Acidimicrobiia bacterium]